MYRFCYGCAIPIAAMKCNSLDIPTEHKLNMVRAPTSETVVVVVVVVIFFVAQLPNVAAITSLLHFQVYSELACVSSEIP